MRRGHESLDTVSGEGGEVYDYIDNVYNAASIQNFAGDANSNSFADEKIKLKKPEDGERFRQKYRGDSVQESTDHDFPGITIAETIGKRDEQQDSVFVVCAGEADGVDDVIVRFGDAVREAVDEYQSVDWEGGTTLCSAFVKGDRLVVCNLGDSRAVLTIRHKNGEYKTISLSEDHNPNLPRIRKYVEDNGGWISSGTDPRVRGELAMGAAIGDNDVGQGCEKKEKDCLLRNPDIWQFDLKDFLRDGESLSDVSMDVTAACDGLFDVMQSDIELYCEENGYHGSAKHGGIKERKLSGEYNSYLRIHKRIISKFKKVFDEGRVVRRDDGSPYNNFAEALRDRAINLGSTDNVSVANISVIAGGKRQIKDGRAVLAAVCDGHGYGGGKASAESCNFLLKEFRGVVIGGLEPVGRLSRVFNSSLQGFIGSTSYGGANVDGLGGGDSDTHTDDMSSYGDDYEDWNQEEDGKTYFDDVRSGGAAPQSTAISGESCGNMSVESFNMNSCGAMSMSSDTVVNEGNGGYSRFNDNDEHDENEKRPLQETCGESFDYSSFDGAGVDLLKGVNDDDECKRNQMGTGSWGADVWAADMF